ncbi:hypothetical protein SteCoe_13754 [Stentor coeruleus]|uniref:Cyclic nucleotide-binding domain-containing protein n=1 Tax=Stentor coeruleus TaxID=5963 RepID=A0A1R2C7N4_9CILI|nr:hypothetical protein SteCoe_13754 [Stentor coeruleus]
MLCNEDENDLSFLNPPVNRNSALISSKNPSAERIEYLWKKARRFSRAIGRLIKVWKDIRLYGGSRNHYASTIAWKESIEIQPTEVGKNILMPTSPIKKVWTIINMILLMWTASVTPYEICFIDDTSGAWFGIDLVIDILFFIDIVINFVSAYPDFEGKLVTDRKKIFRNYMTGWFFIDIIGVLPFQYLANIGGYNKLVRFSRMPRIYKVLRVVRLFKMVRLLRSQACIAKIVSFFRLATGLIRMVKFCFTVLLVVHVIGCFWYYLAKLEEFSPDTWVFRYGMLEYTDGDIYLASIYYVIQTLATVGFGDIVPYTSAERIFALILMGVGVGFYSYTISNLSTIMATLDTRTSNLKRRLAALNEFANATKLPESIKKKIKTHITHNHEENVYSWFDKDALLKELPSSLRREISIHMHKKIVDQISFFQDKDPQFISYVVPKLKNVHMQAGEILCKEGDYAEEIFFLVKGRVNLKTSTGIVFKSYLQGSYFGEVEILHGKPRQHTMQIASRYAEFLVISKRDFLNILKEFPNISCEVRETAKVREMKNQEAKVFAINMNKPKPRVGLKRSNTIKDRKKKKNQSNDEGRGWSYYSNTVSGNMPPNVSLGVTTWEKKANITQINSNNPYNHIKKANFCKRNEVSTVDYSFANNPTISSIVFSPAQFKLRNESIKAKKLQDNEFKPGEMSPGLESNDSIAFEESGPKNIRTLLVELNYEEAEAEKVLLETIRMLTTMEGQQKSICDKITEFLDN